MSLVGIVVLAVLVIGVGLLLVQFSRYDSEAAAEDREAQDECEHRSAPVHDDRGILICPDCDKDLEE